MVKPLTWTPLHWAPLFHLFNWELIVFPFFYVWWAPSKEMMREVYGGRSICALALRAAANIISLTKSGAGKDLQEVNTQATVNKEKEMPECYHFLCPFPISFRWFPVSLRIALGDCRIISKKWLSFRTVGRHSLCVESRPQFSRIRKVEREEITIWQMFHWIGKHLPLVYL